MKLHDIFEATVPSKVLCILPGGFHPFHNGHASVYQYLRKKFPMADVYIASTNNTKERPFPFKEKQFLASQAGIPKDSFVEVTSPYRAMEITQHYNPEDTVLIFALSEKDKDRLGKPLKKDGTPSYMQPFPGSIDKCQSFSKHGYYVVTPTIKFEVLGQSINSASQIREMYKNADDKTRLDMVEDMYPNSPNIQRVKKILDKVLGTVSISEAIFQKKPLSEVERNQILDELLPYFNLKTVPGVIVADNKNKGDMHLGSTLWSVHDSIRGDKFDPYIFGISINPSAARDKEIYRAVLAHELCHYEDLQDNILPKVREFESRLDNKHAADEWVEKNVEHHGPTWKAIAARVNAKLGVNYITPFANYRFRKSIFGNVKTDHRHKTIDYEKDFTPVTEHIVKLKNGKYRLLSHKGKNLGTFDSHAAAAKHEGEVEYFKHMKESPDFGYGDFHNRDTDLTQLEWSIRNLVPTGEAVGIFASEIRKGEEQQTFEFAPERYVVARLGLQLEEDDNGKMFRATVRKSGISPEWKGTGLGQILYDKAIAYAKKRGCKFFCSDVGGLRSMEAESAWQKLKKRYPVESHSNYYIIDLSKV